MSDAHLRLTEKQTLCPGCGAEYKSLTHHWGHKPNHRPPLDYLQHATVAGLVLGGCRIHATGQTPVIDVRTQYLAFAVWLHEMLDWMSNTIHWSAPGDRQQKPRYIVRTVPHPELDPYRRWCVGDDRPSAAQTLYSPLTVRTWVAKTAGAGWSGHAQSRTTRFNAETDAKHRWYKSVLDHLGYEPYDSGTCFYINQTDSEHLFGAIGPPVPGVEHKWEFDRTRYDEVRRKQWVDQQLTDGANLSEGCLGLSPRAQHWKHSERELLLALREAAVDGELTYERYNDWRSSTPYDALSLSAFQYHARWSVWKSLAGLNTGWRGVQGPLVPSGGV